MERINWTKTETYLLVDKYLEYSKKEGYSLSKASEELSVLLRQYGQSNGIVLDDVYRNMNGINMKFMNIEYLLTSGEIGLSGYSQLDLEVVQECVDNFQVFKDNVSQSYENVLAQINNNLTVINNDISKIAIDRLKMSVRLKNSLRCAGIFDVASLLKLSETDFLKIKNLGTKTLQEVITLQKQLMDTSRVGDLFNLVQSIACDRPLIYDLSSIGLSVRAFNSLKKININSIEEFILVSQEQIENIKDCGYKTISELLLKQNDIRLNDKDMRNKHIKNLLSKIAENNYDYSVQDFCNEKNVTLLKSLGISSIGQLCNIEECQLQEIEFDYKNIIEMAGKLHIDFDEMIENKFLKMLQRCKKSGEPVEGWEKDYKVLLNRARGMTLESAVAEFNLTRERARQIEKRATIAFGRFFDDAKYTLYLHKLLGGKQYIFENEFSQKYINYGEVIVYLLKITEIKYVKYINEYSLFIFGEDWYPIVNKEFDSFPTAIIQDEYEMYFEKINNVLLRNNFDVDSVTINKIFETEYQLSNGLYSKRKIKLFEKYKMIIERYYSNGIDVYDDLVLIDFRKYYKYLFNDDEMPDSNRALSARLAGICILIGRGRYGLKKDFYIDSELLKKIDNYIFEYDYTLVMTNTLFHMFGKELKEYGVDNKYYLQGILHEFLGHKYNFRRDYISKSDDDITMYQTIIDYIRDEKGVVSKEEIKNEFVAIPEIVVNMATSDILILNYLGKYLHTSNIELDESDLALARQIIDNVLIDFKPHHAKEILDIMLRKQPTLLSSLQIDQQYSMFSFIRCYFNNDYELQRPFIAPKGVFIVNWNERIKNFVFDYEQLLIQDIVDFAKESNISFNSILDILNGLDGYYITDSKHIARDQSLHLPKNILCLIETDVMQVIGEREHMLINSYLAETKQAEISSLNMWLVYSILKNGSDKFSLYTSSNQFKKAVPIIARKNLDEDYIRNVYCDTCKIEESYLEIDDLDDIDGILEKSIDVDDLIW